MAYVKTNWQNGVTPINAANLNKIENQIEANQTDFDSFSSTDKDWVYDSGTSGSGVNVDGTLSIPANGYIQVHCSVAKTGFTPKGIIGLRFGATGSTSMIPNRYYVSGNTLIVLIRNTSSSPTSNLTLNVDVIYKKA